MLFKFIREDRNTRNECDKRVVYETDSISLNDVLFDFTEFLRGCGYSFDGTLDIVQDESDPENKSEI